LISLRSFEIQGIVDGDGHLAGDALHELHLGVRDLLLDHAAEAHRADPALRRGEGRIARERILCSRRRDIKSGNRVLRRHRG